MDTHPSDLIQQYKKITGLAHVRVVYLALTESDITVCDPSDPDQMDFPGFAGNADILVGFLEGEFTIHSPDEDRAK